MPDHRPIVSLRERIREAMLGSQHARVVEWGNPRAMTEVLRGIKRDLGGADGTEPTSDQVKKASQWFAANRQVRNFTELKYVCYGVLVPIDGETGPRVIDDRALVECLLQLVRERDGYPAQFRRCYQGLLRGYFSFDRSTHNTSPGYQSWTRLRTFLDQGLESSYAAAVRRGSVPDWLQMLSDHANLLTANPCGRYATSLIEDRAGELKELFDGLGIPSDSWVWNEVLMAYVRAVGDKDDEQFKQSLTGVLQLVNGQSDLKLPQLLAVQATAMVVKRYSGCSNRPEDPKLRDTCLNLIGNPWLDPIAWSSRVDHEPARTMVEGWLKRRLIKDFFELLAQDGAADLRRLNYWLKWEPEISDMWFVLGEEARRNKTEAFLSVRKRMADRERYLADAQRDDNAFVMRIGPLLVIEFGVTNNACYIFTESNFPVDLDSPRFSKILLKQTGRAQKWLSHNGSWESTFDRRLRELLIRMPTSMRHLLTGEPRAARPEAKQPTYQASPVDGLLRSTGVREEPRGSVTNTRAAEVELQSIRYMCAENDIVWEDNRPNKGALWILLADRARLPQLTQRLENFGFAFKAGNGFWIK